jgi:hypothetical protein
MRLDDPGTGRIRDRLGIEAEDPRLFHPYTPKEIVKAADILARDERLVREAPRLVPILRVGLLADLRVEHLTLPHEEIARIVGHPLEAVSRAMLVWECAEPSARAWAIQRATRMILVWRAQKRR